jgi:hypothetical protein
LEEFLLSYFSNKINSPIIILVLDSGNNLSCEKLRTPHFSPLPQGERGSEKSGLGFFPSRGLKTRDFALCSGSPSPALGEGVGG